MGKRSTIFCNVFLLLVTPMTIAFASAPPRSLGGGSARSRVVGSKSEIKVEERTDNKAEKKQKLSTREKRENAGGRVNRNEIEGLGIERKLGKALDQEITYMERVISKLPKNSDQRPEILRRLTENYHQKALLAFFEESRTYDEAWKRWDAGGRKGQEPMLSQNRSSAFTQKAIASASQFIKDYPKHKRVDDAYFQVAFSYDQAGKRKEAAAFYSQLVARFPNSARLPDAYFSLGEYYFDQQDFRKALTNYNQVRRFNKSVIYPWAIYKMAWCHFNLQKYRESLGAFQEVVQLSSQAPSMSAQGRLRMKEEALRDQVAVWAELGDLEGAEAYFARVGGDKYYGDLLLRLADILRDRGQYDQSVNALKKFIARNPNTLKAADTQIQIVDTAALKADKKLLWQEMEIMLGTYGPKTEFGNRNKTQAEYKELEDRMFKVALIYPKKMHAQAQKNNSKYFYYQAELGYNVFLKHYGDTPEAGEVRFHMGEIQYFSERYSQATRTFMAIVAMKDKTKYFNKSAEYLISSAYIPIEKDMKGLRARPAKLGQQPSPIPAPMVDYIKVCDQYVIWFPKDKNVLNCQIDTAEIYLKLSHYDEAQKRLMVIAKEHPTKPEGKNAAELLLWMTGGDKAKLIALANELSKQSQYTQGDLGKRLATIREARRFEDTLAIEKSGNFLQAAQEFEKIATQSPNAADADKAWYNAGVNYKRAGEVDKSSQSFSRLISNYPKSTLLPDAMLGIISNQESALMLAASVQSATAFLTRFPKDKRAPVVAREACFMADASGDVARTTQVCGQVMATKDANGVAAANVLLAMYERTGRHRDLVRLVDTEFPKLPMPEGDRMLAQAKAADAERKLGNNSAASRREAALLAAYAKKPGSVKGVALTSVANAEFDRQMPVYQKFKSTRLEARRQDGSDLQASIESKQKALQGVDAAFNKVVAMGDAEWTVAALFTMGSAYEQFAGELRNPPLPPGVPADMAQKIKQTFEGLSKAPMEKAKAIYLKASEVAAKGAISNDYSRRVTQALTRLDPAGFKKLDEWMPNTFFVGSQWMDVGSAGKAISALGGN